MVAAIPFTKSFSPDCGASQNETNVMKIIKTAGETTIALYMGDERSKVNSNAIKFVRNI
jgi:hypothetical protein